MNIVENQHVFPAKSISRFIGNDGGVKVNLFSNKKILDLKPNNKIFCKKSIWSQRAEQGFGLRIEDNFQNFVENYLLKGFNNHKCPHEVVSEFYALWLLRSNIENYGAKSGFTMAEVKGINLADQQKKILESKHMYYLDKGGSIDSRFCRDIFMQREIDIIVSTKLIDNWYVCVNKTMSFIVPDNPRRYLAVPITPSICLIYGGSYKGFLSEQETREINMSAIISSERYYFSNCFYRSLYA